MPEHQCKVCYPLGCGRPIGFSRVRYMGIVYGSMRRLYSQMQTQTWSFYSFISASNIVHGLHTVIASNNMLEMLRTPRMVGWMVIV